jgi:prepilin peptidase CpaA
MRTLYQSAFAPGLFASALLASGLILLIVAGLHDCAVRTVPNLLCALLLLCGLALRLIGGDVGHGMLAGVIVFAVCTLVWRFGWLGGGDVKLLAAAAVFEPPPAVPELVLYTSLAGGILALLYLVAGRLVPAPASTRPHRLLSRIARCELWRLRRRGPLPYAAAIAAGGICATLSP